MEFISLIKGTKKPYDRHKVYNSMDGLQDAAILLDNQKGVVYVDFDNLDSNKGYENNIIAGILKEYPSSLVVITPKGKHLYYRTNRELKQWNRGFLCGGFQTDGKMGNAYGVIKQNGVVRSYQGELSFDNLTPLPDILLPMTIGKDINNLCGLRDGEGRHDKLLRHLCQIRKNYDDVDIESIGRFINKYVFAEPMEEEGLMNVVNSALEYDINAIDISDKQKKSNRLIEVCKMIADKYNIHIANNKVYFYENGRFYNDDNRLMKIIYSEYQFSKSEYEEILFQLKINGKEEQQEKSIILLKNGSIVDGKYTEDNDTFSSSYLDVIYDPLCYDANVDRFLQFITNNENSIEKNDLRIVLEEMLGHCLMTKSFPHKLFLLLGSGANGKSTFINMLYNFFGDLAVNIPINRLGKDEYVAMLVNKLVNISDDIDFDYIKSSQNIKTLASGDEIMARELYSKPFRFRNKATMIFTMNEMIMFSDHTYGMSRRLCIIPFENTVKNIDPKIEEKLNTDSAKSYILNLALEGMERINVNKGQLTESEIVEKIVQDYMTESDSVFSFLQYGNWNLINEAFSVVYDRYCLYCNNCGYTPYNKNSFSRRIKLKGYTTKTKTVGGMSVKVVIKDENIL